MKQSIFDAKGQRLYVTPEERRRFLRVTKNYPHRERLFCQTLALTGCRIPEALTLDAEHIDRGAKVVVFATLKQRRSEVFRMVPVPGTYLQDIQALGGDNNRQLWPWCRTTGYTLVKDAMREAGISGPPASPKGLRHGFAIYALSCGVPLTLIQKWLGHTSIETTAIYLQAVGAEEYRFAKRMWAAC